MGSLEVELIEPDHNPSTWRESLDKHGVIDLDGLCLHELDHAETRGIPCRGLRGTAAAGADTGAEGHVAAVNHTALVRANRQSC
jgi:hypothetical protein